MTIPLRPYRSVALVEVQVNRKHSEWFLFDTGAQRTVMSDAAARRCGLRPHLMRLNVFKLGKGLVEARPVVVDELRLPNGAFSTRNLLAYVLPDAEFESDYAGILGILEPCGDIWAVALCKRGEGQA
jgi:predicted aspartyl protease